MSRATQELQAIPFRHLIGAPLTAVIQGQAEAAQTTIEFIERVGFTRDDTDSTKLGKTRTVIFNYEKVKEDGTRAETAITVPVLSIIPIPYIRIEDVEIDFKAKITDIETTNVTTSTNISTEARGAYSSWLSPVRVEFRGSFSRNKNTSATSRFDKEYQMDVRVRAIQDDMPAGLSTVLQLLEGSIAEVPTTTPR